jgi:hypothetical protein
MRFWMMDQCFRSLVDFRRRMSGLRSHMEFSGHWYGRIYLCHPPIPLLRRNEETNISSGKVTEGIEAVGTAGRGCTACPYRPRHHTQRIRRISIEVTVSLPTVGTAGWGRTVLPYRLRHTTHRFEEIIIRNSERQYGRISLYYPPVPGGDGTQ